MNCSIRSKIDEKVMELIHKLVGTKKEILEAHTADSLFGKEIRMTGLEAAYLFVELERCFGIKINEEDLKRCPFTCVENISRLIEQKL